MTEQAFRTTCTCGADLIGTAGAIGADAGRDETVTCLNRHEWSVRGRRVGPDGAMSWRLGMRLDEYSRRPN